MSYTDEDVMRVRDERQCGIQEAKDILEGRALKRTVLRATTQAELQNVLLKLIDRVYPT